jgi:hypothetical protein
MLAERYQYINQNKRNIKFMVDDANNRIKNNLERISQSITAHKEFYNFVNIMNLFEIYNWEHLKNEYNFIKKDITKDKNLNKPIIKTYSEIISYCTEIEINDTNNMIKKISDDIQLMLFEFIELKKIHNETTNKCKIYSKSEDIIKIPNLIPEIEPYIKKMYEFYIDIKQINDIIKMIKNKKKKLLVNNETEFNYDDIKNKEKENDDINLV